MPTAATNTDPTTICWKAESKPSSTMPDCSDWITKRADQRAGDRADAAGERRAADDGRGDDVELVERADLVGGRIEARRIDAGGDAGERSPSARTPPP